MNFQTYVIIFFILLLIVILIFLGVTMDKNKVSNMQWPPIISSCPDYWTDTPDEATGRPHIPGSRCIGIIGNNTGKLRFDPINSKCTDKTLTLCDPEKCSNCKTSTVDFSTAHYSGARGRCAKQSWASKYISWDGITYGFGQNNPCQ